jgi:hypothetical protein
VLAEPSRVVTAMTADDALRAIDAASTDGVHGSLHFRMKWAARSSRKRIHATVRLQMDGRWPHLHVARLGWSTTTKHRHGR